MQSPLERAIRDHLDRFVAGDLALRDFNAWFVSATLNIEQANDPGAENLTWEIFLRLAEYSNGHRTLDETKELLRAFAETSANTPAVMT